MDLETLTIPLIRRSDRVREFMPYEHRYIDRHYNDETIVLNKEQLAYVYASISVQGSRYNHAAFYHRSIRAIEEFITEYGIAQANDEIMRELGFINE